ncbi:serine hydrolase domain-containing protein [Phenylobacterium sp.]|uniref:serine hydrolase domain-containing protein n=1 Tax=Phenylobacterium sp. TaxID=1871053 RepID=UPI002FCB71EC
MSGVMAMSSVCAPAQAADGRALRRDADSLFRPYSSPGAPGGAVLVMDGGKPAFSATYGRADIEHDTPVSLDTVFHVASLTKSFTAYGIALLEADGKLSRRDSIRRYVPELAPYADNITLEHLIHHTSGIRDHIGLSTLAGWRPDDTVDSADVFRMIRRQTAGQFAPGSMYDYSNSNYFLLALVIQRVSGKSYADFMRETIFVPAGMTATVIKETPNQLIRGQAKSYEQGPDGRYRRAFLQFGYAGDTNLMTSIRDLGRWGDFVMTSKIGGRPAYEVLAETRPLAGGGANDYGWGFEVGQVGGQQTLRHGGSDAGFRAHILLIPGQRKAVVVAANSDQVSMSVVADTLATRLTGQRRGVPRPKAAASKDLKRALREYAGVYRLENGLVFTFEDQAGAARLEVFGLGTFMPTFVEPNRFVVPSANSEVRFSRTDKGVLVEVEMSGGVTTGRRVDAASARLPQTVLGPTFYCDELFAAYRVDAPATALRSALGDPIGLLPLDASSFMLKTWGSGVGSVAQDPRGGTVLTLKTFRGGTFSCPERLR